MAAVEDESFCAVKVWIGWGMAEHCGASIWTHSGAVRSMPIRAGVAANPEMTTKDERPVADPHFSCRYCVCPAMGKGLPLVSLMTCW